MIKKEVSASPRTRRTFSSIDPRPLVVEDFPEGARTDISIPIHQNAMGIAVNIPLVVLRGKHPGPVVGISAAVHGNELNGIKIIHSLLERANPHEMRGTLLCAPVVNVPAFQAGQRRFPHDEMDLNSAFPGKKDGKPSQQYARAFLVTFLPCLDTLIDIHTASEGRINSLYVRADLLSPRSRELALLMHPEIILHGRSGDGTLRNAARQKGIPAITVEAGNPSEFQGVKVHEGQRGIMNILSSMGILEHEVPSPGREPVICSSSRWLRTRAGGLLDCHFDLCQHLEKGQVLADVRNSFGHLAQEYRAPGSGIVIGMSRSPIAVPGTRFCHLGKIGEPEPRPKRREPAETDR